MKTDPELKRRLDLLDKYDDAYYNGKPLVSDAAYDLFKDGVLRQLPPDHPRLAKVGHVPSSGWSKESHDIAMGSQNKVDNEDDIRAYVDKTLGLLGVKSARWVLQHKLDGFSLELKYAAKIKSAVTRGNGVVGENITPNVCMFRDVPGILPIANKLAVRGEGLFNTADYQAVQRMVGDKYENPRNAAAGIARRYDGKYSKYIRFMAYNVTGKAKTEMEKVAALKKLGFDVVETYECPDVEGILDTYRKVKEQRPKLPYEIDGLVLKLDSIEQQDQLGVERNRPLGQMALKFDSDQASTKVLSIVPSVGRTGRVAPVATLAPVKLMGSTIRKASVHNYDYIRERFIGVGAEVTIEKRGDIIPQIVEVVVPGDDYEIPDICPSCESKLEDDGVNLWCRSKRCHQRDVARITYWLQVIGVKGFSDSFVDALYLMGKVKSVADLYSLQKQDVAAIPGMGQKTIMSFFKALMDTNEMFLEKFIEALGIPKCAKSTAALLAERYGTWDGVAGAKAEDLMKLSKIGESKAASIIEGLEQIAPIADDILRVVRIKRKVVGPLTGKSFCVTGSLKAMDRKTFQNFVAERGGVAKTSVGAGLGYLVTNDPNSGSSKNRKATKLGVKIIDENEFFTLAGGAPAIPADDKPGAVRDDSVRIVTESLFEG